jgi:hypothetical protein
MAKGNILKMGMFGTLILVENPYTLPNYRSFVSAVVNYRFDGSNGTAEIYPPRFFTYDARYPDQDKRPTHPKLWPGHSPSCLQGTKK